MTSETRWKYLWKETKALSPDPSPTYIQLFATKGDVGDQLYQLDHWPESVAALEGVLRDFYIGLRLEKEKDTKP